jgi:hypothetical protein
MLCSTVARLVAVAVLAGRSLGASVPVAYCSTQNTGSSFDARTWPALSARSMPANRG